MTQDITAITVVPDSKAIFDYQRGEIGEPFKSTGESPWILCCPGCGNKNVLPQDRITQNEDGTVSSTQPLYCHGSKSRQQYTIEKNAVRWL